MIKVTPTEEKKHYIDFNTGQAYPSGVITLTEETPWVRAKLRLNDLRIVEDDTESNLGESSELTLRGDSDD